MYESLLVLCTFALLTPCCFKPVGWLAKLAPCKLIVHALLPVSISILGLHPVLDGLRGQFLLEDTSRNGHRRTNDP
jgi:hypothetical protein